MFYGDKSTLFEQDKQKQHHPEQPTIAIIGGSAGCSIINALATRTHTAIHYYHGNTPLKTKSYQTVQYHADQVIALMGRDGGWRLACQSGKTTLVSLVILAFTLPDQPRQSDDLLIQNLLAQGLIQPAPQGIELNYPYVASQRQADAKKLFCAYADNGLKKPSDKNIAALCNAIQLAF